MRVVMMACVAAVLVSASAFGVNYTFVGASFPAPWNTTANWNDGGGGGLVLPGTTADSYLIALDCGTTQLVVMADPSPTTSPATAYFGSVTVTGGNLRLPTGMLSTRDTYRFVAGNGQDGSLLISGTNARFSRNTYNVGVLWDMDGSFRYLGPTMNDEATGTTMSSEVRMRGANTVFTFSSNSDTRYMMQKLTIDAGASVSFVAPPVGFNAARQLVVNGPVSGKVWVPLEVVYPRARVTVGPTVDVSQLDLSLSVPSATITAWQLQGAHYRDLDFSTQGWIGGAGERAYTLCIVDDDLWVRDLKAGYQIPGGSDNPVRFVVDTDNNGVTRNLRVDRDLLLGSNATKRPTATLKANSSDVRIGRDLLLYRNPYNAYGSYVTATTATFRLGRNFTVDCGTLSAVGWNMGASTFICDGNGLSLAQTITSKGLPFYDFRINNPGGSVTLADRLTLNGDLDVECGTFATGGNYIIFKGGIECETLAQEIDVDTGVALSRVYIQAGSSTFVKLMNNLIVSDNLDIDTGCKLFLNGFTLDLTGSDAALFLGENTLSGAGTWTLKEGGEIIGGAAIPEPATLLLIGTGALGVLGYIRRRRMV